MRFEIDEKHPFSRSITLNAPSSNLGVGMWESVGNVQQQVAGLADVNGDGLVDRVIPQIQPKQTRAYLGTYLGTARTFSNVYITLPGELARQESDQAAQCKVGPRFTSSLTQGLRDLTGDGIPDYYDKGRVWIGTGSGFAPSSIPVEVAGAHFMFSHQTESCDGNFSNTDGGLFDIDGDGKPEVIGLVPLNGGRAYLVSQLAAGSVPRTLEAGRLTVVDNGYGARTQIAYMSAKEDLFTNHQVPFPEIVVSSVETEGTQHLGGTLFGTRYAYGGAEMIFNWAHDGFIFSGYRRTAELRVYNKEQDKAEGVSTVIDTWPLIPVSPPATKEERWLRTQRVGHVRDIYTLRGMFGTDPWPLLTVDANDEGVIGVSHYEWGAKLFEGPASLNTGRDCVDMLEPLDFEASLSALGAAPLIPCRAHGFVFPLSNESWYGSRPPPMTNNVQARSRALEVDDFGRVTFAEYEGDLFRSDDNICVESTFATPNAAFPRVLAAPASRRITDCGRRFTYAGESWAYDGLPVGIVSNGRMTSHTVDRRATDNGALLRTVRAFDATYNAAGNLTTLRSQRDGAMRTFTFSYDPFGLVRNKTRVDATGLPSTESLVTYNPVSLEPLSSIDINGTQRGAIFDGFGRLLRSTVTPPGGALGVVSTVNYEGFSGADPNGRRILLKEFSDPMPPADVATATGRTATVFLDELGRERRMELALGSDYANEVLVAGSRIYDGLGRVTFEADPYPMSQNAAHAYGTSYHFKNTGDVDCIIRGRRQQELSEVTDVATERFPTCFDRLFENHVETLEVRDAASLQAGSPQAGVVNRIVSSAIGRLIERSTVRPSPGGSRLDYATFSYDRLGQQTSMTRFLNPAGGTDPVRWAWRLDSTGQTLQLDEPETVTRFYTYSDWGEPVETRWTDGTIDRRLVSRYDAFGRLVATEERNNGVADAKTVNNYAYDIGVNVSPHVTPRFVLGRLARASSPNSQVAFSYDAFGRVNARTFTDNESGLYIEKYEYHADGSPALLEFNLPDQSYSREVVKYAYDSARRLRAMTHDDLTGNRELYRADLIDPFGRVRSATHGGNTTYKADYADEGRRLVKEVRVESSSGSRQVIFLRHDPIGRELSRREIKDGEASGPKTNVSYDALGRLANAVKTTGTTTHFNWSFSYDALGNIVKLQDTLGAAGAALTFGTADRDRMCAISYGGPTPTVGVCNVAHDVLGNVVRQPTRTGTRQLSYFSSGAIRTITEGNTTARFEYDAFGQVQKLDVQSATAQNNRRDRRFGELIERRDAEAGGSTMSFLTRHIPGPGGIASRRGPGNNWVFEFGELRGNRFFTNQDGAFVQNVDYQPFGETTSTGASVGSANYTSYQWNGGDALAAFGLSHLGARVYDPVIGRFLSRDPLMVLRSASNTSPYAFALNDPVNFADPTGLDSVYQADQEDDGVWRDFGYFSILSKTSLFWSADILEAGLARFGTIQPPSGFRVLPSRGAIAVSRVSLTGDLLEVGERLVDLMLDHSGDTGVKKGYLVLAVGNLASSKLGWWALPVKVGVAIGTARWEAQQDEEQRQETKIRDLKYPIRVAAQKWAREELPKLREQERLLGERSTVSEDDEEEIHNFLNPVYGPPPPFIGPPLPPNFKPVKPGTPGSGGAGFNPIIFPPPTPPDERPFP